MKDVFVFAQLLNEFFDSVFVKESLLFAGSPTLIGERDLQAGIEKRQLAQARRQPLKLKLRRDGENRRIGQERNQCAGDLLILEFADNGELVRRFAFGEGHVIDLAVARDFHLKPFRKCVGALRADAVQSARILVCALSEFSAGMQIRQHQLDGRHLPFRMNIDRNTTAVVAHRDRSIDMDDHVDLVQNPARCSSIELSRTS